MMRSQIVTASINEKRNDRYIIIDDHVLYHVGASFKDLGNKCFSINKIIDDEYLNSLLKKIVRICVK